MGKLGGIHFFEKVEAFGATKGDMLDRAYSITTDARRYMIGARSACSRFADVCFDSSTQWIDFELHSGIDLHRMLTFIACWWSGGRTALPMMLSTLACRATGLRSRPEPPTDTSSKVTW